LVEHGDLLSELKRVQEGLFGGFERELTTPNTLLITGFLNLILMRICMQDIGYMKAEGALFLFAEFEVVSWDLKEVPLRCILIGCSHGN